MTYFTTRKKFFPFILFPGLSDSVKQSTITQAHSKGAVVLISLGGATDSPYSHDAYSLGVTVC
jgi:hypothetical protein